MIVNNFRVYRKFFSTDDADEIIEVLKLNNIPYSLSDNSPSFDPTFSFTSLDNQIELRIQNEHFDTVNKLLEEKARKETTLIEGDYYLYSFSDSELEEVIGKPDKWSELDYELAKKILTQRGKKVSESELSEKKEKRYEEITTPERISSFWIAVGFFCALSGFVDVLIFPLLLGYIFKTFGIAEGLVLIFFTKTNIHGKKYFVFDKQSRFLGKMMVVISIIALGFNIYWIIHKIF